jgi:hypothetical protein
MVLVVLVEERIIATRRRQTPVVEVEEETVLEDHPLLVDPVVPE